MELSVAIRLIKDGVQANTPQTWADLGCGKGLFTKALASLLSSESKVYAIDNDSKALQSVEERVNGVSIDKVKKDFVLDPVDLKSLDGILMANAMHFVQRKKVFTSSLRKMLKPAGRILLVEYDTDQPNPWVPYPISFKSLTNFGKEEGFRNVIKLDEVPSLYGRANIYSALLEL